MPDSLRVAVVGAGLQGRRRSAALRGDRLTVVASSTSDDARALAREHGARTVGHWSEAVTSDDVDVVLVCTPPDSHAEITLAAVAGGKHVLCEKPMARTWAEAAEMAEAGRRAGVVVACGFNHRFHPAVARLRELIAAGELGLPLTFRCAYGIAGRPGYEREWRFDPQVVSGGHLMEQGIHAVDLAQWLLGEATEVTAVCTTQHWPVAPLEDNAMVLLRCSSGATAEIHSSLTQWVNLFRLEVGTEAGMAVVEGLGGSYGNESLTLWRRTDGPFNATTTVFRGGDISWREEFAEFKRKIQAGEVAETANPGISAIRVVEHAYRADRERTWITIRRTS